ncbi:MopE-related protein, partial [Myxococcota bacterium]
ARETWFAGTEVETSFSSQIAQLHEHAADAAYHSIRSAYETATGADNRSCNAPPRIISLDESVNGNTLTIDPTVDETCSYFRINWGDGNHDTGSNLTSRSHVYGLPGTYHVMLYVRDNDSTFQAANVRWAYITVGGAVCPDESCTGSETCLTCPADCGPCCGDGSCTAAHSENCESCAADCPTGATEVCCSGALFDGECCSNSDCDAPEACDEHLCTAPTCGDTSCNGTEDCLTCPDDCGACCGDAACTSAHSEDCATCPADCPTPTGEVCCAGALFAGDCCEDGACVAPETCVGYQCLSPSSCESDADGDHYGVGASCAGPDCDDADPTIHPAAQERCNSKDENCDGAVDEDWPELGTACASVEACGTFVCTAGGEGVVCDNELSSGSDCAAACDGDCGPQMVQGGCNTTSVSAQTGGSFLICGIVVLWGRRARRRQEVSK